MSKDVITAKEGITIERAKEVLHQHRIEKLPVVNSNKHIIGLITSKDILKMEEYPFASKDKKGRLLVGAAVGVKGDYLELTEALLESGADSIVVDIAHGHSDNAINTVRNIKKAFPSCELNSWKCCYRRGDKRFDLRGSRCGQNRSRIRFNMYNEGCHWIRSSPINCSYG